jgi:hypothetical protein
MVDLTDATTGVEPIYKGAPHTLHILLPYIAAAVRERESRAVGLSLSLVLMVYARHHKQARANYQGFIRLLTYPHSLPRRLEQSQIFNRTLPPRAHALAFLHPGRAVGKFIMLGAAARVLGNIFSLRAVIGKKLVLTNQFLSLPDGGMLGKTILCFQ